MSSWAELLKEWEIQLLVILSFMLQVFLFFTGGHRLRTRNILLRLSMWVSYLGADYVAVYALGNLSRHEDATTGRDTLGGTHQLGFLWAPFLLIHLGGQDTITAFAVEDNNLWLRHLLNLVVQVVLALYIFWKSTGWHNVQLLLIGIFLFIAGIIKYVERILALMYGDIRNTKSSIYEEDDEKLPQTIHLRDYHSILCYSLHSAQTIRDVLAGRTMFNMLPNQVKRFDVGREVDESQVLKLLEVELAVAFNDLYTKTKLFRTRIGIILRFISQVFLVVALVLFHESSLRKYNKIDIAITYTLFLGSIFLEACAMFVMVMLSPWTWAWLKAREYHMLASITWFLLLSKVGWTEKRPLWSNSMGQYSLLTNDDGQSIRLSQRVMVIILKMARMVGITMEKMFWLVKLLDTENTQVDDKLMKSILQGLGGIYIFGGDASDRAQNWPNLHPLLKDILSIAMSVDRQILYLHIFTEVHLNKYTDSSDMEADAEGKEMSSTTADVHVLVDECRKLSNYILYLVIAQPSMLLLTGGSLQDSLQSFIIHNSLLTQKDIKNLKDNLRSLCDSTENVAAQEWKIHDPPPCKETLEEIKDMWTRYLLYLAGKSRPEEHAAQLARGGELLTFAWLFMAHKTVGTAGQALELKDFFYGII